MPTYVLYGLEQGFVCFCRPPKEARSGPAAFIMVKIIVLQKMNVGQKKVLRVKIKVRVTRQKFLAKGPIAKAVGFVVLRLNKKRRLNRIRAILSTVWLNMNIWLKKNLTCLQLARKFH